MADRRPDAEPRGEGAGEARPRIEVLSSLVADQIAAGEVVERPASVVKELVENALDAGAREVVVELRDGGREWISVRDDGAGMTAEDAVRACLRHATSKLRTLDDLQTIASRGFRGEALASIAAVSEVAIVTRARGSDHGVRVDVREGRIGAAEPAGAPVGTTIEVAGLFGAIPARRKFLRAAGTETGHVTEALQRLALVRPEVGFACRQAGRDLLRHPAVTRPEERLRQVLGAERARAMVAAEATDGSIRVHGFVSRPGESAPQSKAILTYVNGRFVRDRLLLRAILDGFRGVLPQGRYPHAVIQVDLPGSLVDVNVHPAKSEVRFAAGDAVYALVLRAVRGAVAAAGAGTSGGAPVAVEEPSRPPVRDDRPGDSAAAPGEPGRGEASLVGEAPTRYAVRVPPGGRGGEARGGESFVPTQRPSQPAAEPGARGAPPRGGAGAAVVGEAPPVESFGALRIVGQAFRTYIVCEGADRLVLVDQHAAHERVRFERLRGSGAFDPSGGTPVQRLLVPRAIELDAASCERLLESSGLLAAAGFEVERFGDRSLLVRTLPAALDVSTDPEVVLAELAADLLEIGASDRLEEARDALLARIACHGAVRAGAALGTEAMAAILRDLDTIPYAATCPHGRPVLVDWSRGEIARGVRRP